MPSRSKQFTITLCYICTYIAGNFLRKLRCSLLPFFAYVLYDRLKYILILPNSLFINSIFWSIDAFIGPWNYGPKVFADQDFLNTQSGPEKLKKCRQKNSWNQINKKKIPSNCISGSFKLFPQFKNWFLAIFEIAKNGIW